VYLEEQSYCDKETHTTFNTITSCVLRLCLCDLAQMCSSSSFHNTLLQALIHQKETYPKLVLILIRDVHDNNRIIIFCACVLKLLKERWFNSLPLKLKKTKIEFSHTALDLIIYVFNQQQQAWAAPRNISLLMYVFNYHSKRKRGTSEKAYNNSQMINEYNSMFNVAEITSFAMVSSHIRKALLTVLQSRFVYW
jgi:hypothetical protein